MAEPRYTIFAQKLPWRMRAWRRWWVLKGFLELVWKTRQPNLARWAWDIHRIRVAERNYIRDLERAAFFGHDYDE